jgi:hypothetical protein
MLVECLRQTSLFQYAVGGVSRLDLVIYGKTFAVDWAFPHFVVALSLPHKSATVLAENLFNFRGEIAHSGDFGSRHRVRLCNQFEGNILANARIAVLTQHILDQGRKFLAKNFEGSCLGDKRDFIALGYPDMRLFIVVGSDLDGSHFHLFRSNGDNHDKLSGFIEKINNDNELGARCRYRRG